MEKAALAQEKVWLDKPSYDKAERLYFERMAKVVSRKIMESCTLKSDVSSIANTCQDITNNRNTVTKVKSKDNKFSDGKQLSTDILKANKCQKNPKTKDEDESIQKKENVVEKQKLADSTKTDVKEKETSPIDSAKKYNAKEVKEKKNKADTRHRNAGKGTYNAKEVEENVAPVIRSTQQQLPTQGTQQTNSPILPAGGTLANEVAKARQHIKQSLQCMDDIAAVAGFPTPVETKKENSDLYTIVLDLKSVLNKMSERVTALEEKMNSFTISECPRIAICPAKPVAAVKQEKEKEDDDDVDLFGSDSEGEDAEAAKIREERLAAYAAKKSKKPVLIAKSNIILDVKPWDDETDMKAMEAEVRKIETDGLLWGAAKLVPLAFGIHKLQISCVVEDDKVSVDWLTEKIQENEDFVQSVDIAAFNKV